MATEPLTSQIIDNMVTTFEAINPATDAEFWYKPDLVIQADVLDNQTVGLSPVDYTIWLSPGDEMAFDETTGPLCHTMDVYVMVAKKWQPAYPDPVKMKRNSTLTRWKMGNRMIRDIQKAAGANSDWGNLAFNTTFHHIARDFDFPERMALALMCLRIEFDHMRNLP